MRLSPVTVRVPMQTAFARVPSDAIQASDRWHLLRYLGDAVRAVADRPHGAIQHEMQITAG